MQKKALFITAVMCSIAAVLLFLLPGMYHTNRSDKLHVTATTSIIADTIKHIANDHVTIQTLMGPGIDPHSYHAKLSDMRALLQADIIFYNGLHLEGKMANILDKMAHYKPTIAVAQCLNHEQLIESDEFDGIYDPHIWFDVKLWMLIVEHITDTLIKHDPKHTQNYQNNMRTYLDELVQLDTYIQKQVATIPLAKRLLVTTHDAFSYFGKAYHLKVIALQGINLDAEPCIIDMQQLVKTICSYNIPTIFVESSLPHRSMEAICKAAWQHGHKVNLGEELFSDALGSSESNAATYINMIKHNVHALVKGLN